MAPTRDRSPLSEPARPAKRQKTGDTRTSDLEALFAPTLFDESRIEHLGSVYSASKPYKFAVLDALFDDSLLQNVKDEILRELSFTEKETDIYKVHQTGDLASLSYLPPEQLALFPALLKLRDALYSPAFRSFLRRVTGCGPLSGSKQDMSVNSYKQGCHLLNHDDVIGSRRVSYILYMPLPIESGWPEEWGGALELYPVAESMGMQQPEPAMMPSKSISPAWNQFIFFEVQPGQSFHSVEEVVVGTEEDGRQRLSISGWFHKAQEGEEGYSTEEDATERQKSSLEQLSSSAPATFSSYPAPLPSFLPSTPLSETEVSYLSDFLNPIYLQPRTLTTLAFRFAEDSSIQLHDFLCEPLAKKLEEGLRERDRRDGLSRERSRKIPPHDSGVGDGWKLKGPPHKCRYSVLSSPSEPTPPSPLSPESDPTVLMRSLQAELFPSPAFRAWLGIVSSLLPLGHIVEARRFRPGLDYTLAQAEENEARLDAVLCLTPPIEVGTGKGKGKQRSIEEDGWLGMEWGGWECYMAPHEGEEDPAIYQSGSANKRKDALENSLANGNGSNGHADTTSAGKEGEVDGGDEESDDDEGDSGTLLTQPAAFNSLLLVLRDEKVMRFVKYVSAAAEGSRWDVCGEWQVGMVEEEEEDEQEAVED